LKNVAILWFVKTVFSKFRKLIKKPLRCLKIFHCWFDSFSVPERKGEREIEIEIDRERERVRER
jgi:hypothetical protein